MGTHGKLVFRDWRRIKDMDAPAAFPVRCRRLQRRQGFYKQRNSRTQNVVSANMRDFEPITTSGSFTGNASTNGPCVDIGGTPEAQPSMAMRLHGDSCL